MNRTLLSVLTAGVAVVALTVWLTYPSAPKSVGDPSKYRYMHCPKCKREDRYTPAGLDKPCLYCEKELIPTEQSIKAGGGQPNPYGRMIVFIGIELIALMAAVLFLLRKRTEEGDDDYYYLNCERCRQKIRYRMRQVGLAALCPRCKHPFTYPDVDPNE